MLSLLTVTRAALTIAPLLEPAFALSYRAPRPAAQFPAKRQGATYTNPIKDGNYADPWVFTFNQSFYLTCTVPSGGLSIFRSSNLDDFHDAEEIVLWTPPSSELWRCMLQMESYSERFVWDGDQDSDWRMHVLKGSDPADPTKPFTDFGQIGTPDSNYAIDGTVLHNYNGKNYFIWSEKESAELDTVQYLYIAEMSSPTTLVGKRTMIHWPYWPNGTRNEWQWSPSSPDYGVNEGPEILQNEEQTFLTYSACGSWDDCYSVGIMGLNSSALDPLDPNSWWTKDDGPVFHGNNKTVGTGHASFPKDANGVSYITYHGWDLGDEAGWGSREIRTQNFTWNEDGTPNFPSPAGRGEPLPAAAGY